MHPMHATTADSSARPRLNRRRSMAALARTARTLRVALMSPAAAVGGQAVMDGVMMRGPHSWAVAVRRHDGSIAEQHHPVVAFSSRHAWARLPLVRGIVALVESLVIGMRALFVSSEYAIEGIEAKYDDASAAGGPAELRAEARDLHDVEHTASRAATTGAMGVPVLLPHHEANPDPDPSKLGTGAIVLSMVVAVGFSVALFKIVPVSLVSLTPIDKHSWWFVIVEVLIKFAIFCVYLTIVGLMPDMKRVFQYHSAEHKAINAWERGVELEPEAVNAMSRIHVRCGTAFIVWLFIIGLFVFRLAQVTFLDGASTWQIILARPLLLPLIAGISFEILRFAGKHADNPVLRVFLAPGLWFQRLTTRPCRADQCAVAIASLQSVLEFERAHAVEHPAAAAAAHEDAYRVLA
ncbi:MAG: metal-dependent enzyme [Thermoleophilia bacterium]|nr:metal-dependent enzyme [Thermoleophilia bacterium]